MKFKIASVLTVLSCLCGTAANANWQYPGNYLGDGWYNDDGTRFVLSVRGGASIERGTINNEIGSMTAGYWIDPDSGVVVSDAYYQSCGTACSGFYDAGVGDLSTLSADKNFSEFAFAAGVSIGFTVPNKPQWRVELGWDMITESEYNAAPLFDGDLQLSGGDVITVQSGGVHSTVSTNVISVMAFYDFFDGMQKPLQEFIPYVGFGVGYADTKTVLNLSDLYGDLSQSVDLQKYGELEYGVLHFYQSEKNSANIAGIVAGGVSYGISQGVYLDMGLRLMYVPKIKWALSNVDDTSHRDWFSAKNVIYANIMLGLRFEF